jgi:hypothetical protein
LHDLWAKPIRDHDAVDITCVEIARRRLDAQRPREADALADRGGEGRIGTATPHAQDCCVIEQPGRCHLDFVMLDRSAASKHCRMQRAHAQRRAQARNDLHDRLIGADWQDMGSSRRAIMAHARQHRHEWPAPSLDCLAQTRVGRSSRSFGPRRGFAQDQRCGLDLFDRRGGIREARFDDRKCARPAKGLDQIGRRPLGDDHDRTQRCHADAQPAGGMNALTLGIRC